MWYEQYHILYERPEERDKDKPYSYPTQPLQPMGELHETIR